jgi:hypothetical protein
MVPVQRLDLWPYPSEVVRARKNHHEVSQSKVTTGGHVLWEESKADKSALPTNYISLNAKTIQVVRNTLPLSPSRVNGKSLPIRPALVVTFIHTCRPMQQT